MMSSDPLLPDLGSGLINAQWLVLELLDKKGILPREESIEFLQDSLDMLDSEETPDGQTLPIRSIIRALSNHPSNGEHPSPKFVVIEGGKEDE